MRDWKYLSTSRENPNACDLKPTYEGLKVSLLRAELERTLNLKPTYEGLKVILLS